MQSNPARSPRPVHPSPTSGPSTSAGRRSRARLALAIAACAILNPPLTVKAGPARFAPSAPEVSAQGLFRSPLGVADSPLGLYRMDVSISSAPQNRLLGELRIQEAQSETQSALHAIPGPAFWISDVGTVVALETFDPPEIPGTL